MLVDSDRDRHPCLPAIHADIDMKWMYLWIPGFIQPTLLSKCLASRLLFYRIKLVFLSVIPVSLWTHIICSYETYIVRHHGGSWVLGSNQSSSCSLGKHWFYLAKWRKKVLFGLVNRKHLVIDVELFWNTTHASHIDGLVVQLWRRFWSTHVYEFVHAQTHMDCLASICLTAKLLKVYPPFSVLTHVHDDDLFANRKMMKWPRPLFVDRLWYRPVT
jgi:hypothetical protein